MEAEQEERQILHCECASKPNAYADGGLRSTGATALGECQSSTPRRSSLDETAHLAASSGEGPQFTALLGEWSGRQRSHRRAVQEYCRSVLGVPISQGAIPGAVHRVSEALTPLDEAMAVQARRARNLAERQEPELVRCGGRVMKEWPWLVSWAQALPTAGAVQTWSTRLVHLLQQYWLRKDEAGTCARPLEQELSALWPCVYDQRLLLCYSKWTFGTSSRRSEQPAGLLSAVPRWLADSIDSIAVPLISPVIIRRGEHCRWHHS